MKIYESNVQILNNYYNAFSCECEKSATWELRKIITEVSIQNNENTDYYLNPV